MLVFLALISLASASTLQIHRLDGTHTPLNVVQLLRNPGQAIHGLRDNTVQLLGQTQLGQLGLEPNRQQYSFISLQPVLQQQSIQNVLPNDQQLILTSGQPNVHQQLSLEAIQPNRQQISVVSLQPNNQRLAAIETIHPNNQRLATIETVQPIGAEKQIILQPNDQRLATIETIQPIGAEKQIVFQPVVPQNQQQTITFLQPNLLRNPIQTFQIESAAQPLQYSNIAQPLQYSNIVQPIQTAHPRPTFRVENQIASGRGGQHFSYFLRGSDLENQAVLNQPQVSAFRQTLDPAQYSSVSVVDPQISTLLVQPSKQFNVHQIVQQQQQQLK